MPAIDEAVDDLVRERRELGIDEPRRRARPERRCGELAVLVVLRTVHGDERVADHRLGVELVDVAAGELLVVGEEVAQVGVAQHELGGLAPQRHVDHRRGATRLGQHRVQFRAGEGRGHEIEVPHSGYPAEVPRKQGGARADDPAGWRSSRPRAGTVSRKRTVRVRERGRRRVVRAIASVVIPSVVGGAQTEPSPDPGHGRRRSRASTS